MTYSKYAYWAKEATWWDKHMPEHDNIPRSMVTVLYLLHCTEMGW